MWRGKLFQGFTSIVLGIASLSMGLLFVWPSYTLPMIAASNNTILSAPLTEGEEALLGSLPSLGAVVGTATVSLLINNLGRKGGSIYVSLCFIISWIMVLATRDINVILTARFLGGLAGGTNDCMSAIYISEIANDSIRGGLIVVLLLMYSFGMILSYFIGWYCDYNTIAWVNLAICLFRFLMLLAIPESPVYLIKKKRVQDARVAMAVFRGVSPDSPIVDQEITKIKHQLLTPVPLNTMNEKGAVEEMKTLTSELENLEHKPRRFAAIKNLCTVPTSRKAFFIVFMGYVFLLTMGSVPVSVFAKQVFDEYDPSTGDMCSVIFAVVWCLGTLMSSILTDKVGRRAMLMTSSLMVCLSLVILGVFFQTKIVPVWAIILDIMVYIFCFMFGVGTIPYVLMSELFCTEVQTLATTFLIQCAWLGTFFIINIYTWISKLIGVHGTFYIFAGSSLCSATFTYFFVPETTGLTNKEIQMLLIKGKVK